MPRTLSMLRFLGSSDAYPRRASAASALGSLAEPRRCESESERFTMLSFDDVAVVVDSMPTCSEVEFKVAQLSRAAMLKISDESTKTQTKSKQFKPLKTNESSRQGKGPQSSPPTPSQSYQSVNGPIFH
jgi:hypothetical protein